MEKFAKLMSFRRSVRGAIIPEEKQSHIFRFICISYTVENALCFASDSVKLCETGYIPDFLHSSKW